MYTDVMIAGFGGQGIMLAGKLLAHAGMNEGKEVCWLPSYGPEMRGGTANCTVVISSRPIGSPVVMRPQAVLVCNAPSLDKFEPQLMPRGLVVVNTSLVHRGLLRSDLRLVEVPANDIAVELGSPKSLNMVVIGAYLAATAAVSLAAVEDSTRVAWGHNQKALTANLAALARGYAIGAASMGGDA